MTQFNYHFLVHLIPEIKALIQNCQLTACFSQNKNELILEFSNSNRKSYIKTIMDGEVSLISFPEDFARARKNSVDIFAHLAGDTCTDVHVFTNERSFIIRFQNGYDLLFKLHGKLANILLCHSDKVVGMFKHSLTNDQSIIPSQLHREVRQSDADLINHQFNLRLTHPTFDKLIKAYLMENGFEVASTLEKTSLIRDVENQLAKKEFYLYKDQNGLPYLTCLPHKNIQPEQTWSNCIRASNEFATAFLTSYHLAKAKSLLLRKTSVEIRKTEAYNSQCTSKLEELNNRRSFEEIANILMANVHRSIPINSSSIELFDFYSDDNIEIKLNPKLNLQQNAENYYRKAKNQKLESDQLITNLSSKRSKLDTLHFQYEQISLAQNLKELKPFATNDIKTKEAVAILPYHVQIVDGYEVRIGKNAQSNDQLTLKHTNKNDLWLHARDVAGSHIVIKSKGSDNFPMALIEKVAALAAWHSKRKSDTLCPVIYTSKKYITKVKGAPAGAVKVRQEKVILVEPRRMVE